MNGRVAFICGARLAATRRETHRNIRKAADTAVEVARKGYSVILSHTMSTLPELFGNLGETYWIETCAEIIKRLNPHGDVLVLVPDNWRQSDNACKEKWLAEERKVPVYELEDLPDAGA